MATHSPWLTKAESRQGDETYTDWYHGAIPWVCDSSLRHWFDVPKSVSEIRVVRSSKQIDDAYEVIEDMMQGLVLRSRKGEEFTFVFKSLFNFVQVGDWISIEYR